MRVRVGFALVSVVALSGCNCSPRVAPVSPKIVVTPMTLDFGTVPAGALGELTLQITDAGRATLRISSVTTAMANAISVQSVLVNDCEASPRHTSDLYELTAEECAEVKVVFQASEPGTVTNTVLIASGDPKTPLVSVPVTATVVPAPEIQVCVLDANGNVVPNECTSLPGMAPTMPSLAFGTVQAGQSALRKLRILDPGSSNLSISSISLASASTDLSMKGLPPFPATVAAGANSFVEVQFAPMGSGMITGTITIKSNAANAAEVDIPITANEMGRPCAPGTTGSARIQATLGSNPLPASIMQNTTVDLHGSIAGGTHAAATYNWSLVSAPSGNTAMITSNGASASLDCTSAGTYEVQLSVTDSAGCADQPATITINVEALPPPCGPSTKFIYIIDVNGELYKFLPSTLTATPVGSIACAAFSSVNTMAVDRYGTAWVEYDDASIYAVNTATLSCQPTAFNPASAATPQWGSCMALDAVGSTTDTYFVAFDGAAGDSVLNRINTSTMALTQIGTLTTPSGVAVREPELTGTANAELYGFFPDSPNWMLGQIDKTTASVMSEIPLTAITDPAGASAYAFASWGDDFWFFVGQGSPTNVYHYTASTGTTVLATTVNAEIVGAGVSPCVQGM